MTDERCGICLGTDAPLVPIEYRPYPDIPTCGICATAIHIARREARDDGAKAIR